MKIGYLFSRYPVPSQTFCDAEMRALEAAGHEVEIFSCSPPPSSFRHGADDCPRGPVFYAPTGAPLEWVESSARHAGRWPGEMVADHGNRYGERYEPVRRARHAVYFAELLRRRGVEHLHVHFANRATHAALFIHALTGLTFSFTAHAQDFLVDLGNDDLLREMCARASFVVAVSDWSRRALIERCPDAAPKIYRVYNGLPLDRWPRPAPAKPESGPLRIFSVGRLVEFKGFTDLIAACTLLQGAGIEFQCEIAGDGPLRSTLAGLIVQHGLTRNVRLAGLLPQAEIRARLLVCDVFALACRVDEKGACDVLPTVILEAMAAGKPVVSTRLAGIPELVDHGRTGFLTTPGDVPALADALATLAREPARCLPLGFAGRDRLEADFSSTETIRQLAALFPRPDTPPPPLVVAETVCLLDRWPTGDTGLDAALLGWHERAPGLRLVALAAGDMPTGLGTLALVPRVELLPDAMVLEGEWREQAAAAHRIELARGDIGGGPDETDAFLLAARRALYLGDHWQRRGDAAVKHIHAFGAGALRCAWVLTQRGTGLTASFYLAPGEAGGKTGLPGSTLRRLAEDFMGGWIVGERKLAAALGPNFRCEGAPTDLAGWQSWAEWVAAFQRTPPSRGL